jgi:hypothetical protein
MSLLTNISLYGLLGLGVYKSYSAERLDLYCPGEVKKYCKNLCGDNKGKYYVKGQPKNTDNVNELLNKIKISTNCGNSTVKWRRGLLLSVVICILISLVVLGKFPTGKEMFLMVFLTFIVIYFSFSYYEYHYEKYPIININKSVNYIRAKLKLDHLDEELVV